METRANHIWVGLVTLLLLLGAALLTMWIAGLSRNESAQYDIFFKQSVDGLAKGSEVSFSGVPSGQVKDIELWERDPEFVRVRITVDKKVPILEGTTASVQGSFTGVSTIQLTGAHKGAPPIVCPKENKRATCPEGVPVIPTRRSGLGEILSNAPLLLERLATLTERLTMVLSDKNQKSFENILANTDRLSGSLADAGPDVKRTMAELQATLRQANYTLASFEKLTNSADTMLNDEGNGLARQLRQTLKSAQGAADELQGTLADARPAAKQLNERTLPAAEAAIRDLQATTRSLREVTDKLNDKGIGGFVGGPKLPDYED
ncbi:MAG: mammalian cell entry protein [Novosphingobium sp. 28-62-57]|uniref:MlaD family protein n=1 Tax=unclassified Novosphingobium TaxID=2644732 RepID=UPI000BD505A6|nr:MULTISPECIES: MlaD family protein [unclassified Novosphingobium]OYW48277.1 MAG: mammalian cell entry protein [Novosphingobium sp. 12-62-10]OYZ10237.1 MAG: mammalian cell entry protein [Novosphingobium sp. 28-62-57]OZA38046.1 MAG: mammalian cell entry protein [Novosphingobium sp. 17-62-9]HQS70645.1 MlaD family protein [Novosphingobium sp.]